MTIRKLRFYCHKVLPLVYDDSLSYYEVLCKVVNKINEIIENPSGIKIADPVEWNISSQYGENVIVIDSDGTAYISKQPVPSGIQIDDENYWQVIFNYADNINDLRDNIAFNNGDNDTALQNVPENSLVWVHGVLYKTLRDVLAGDAFVEGSNVTQYTVDEKINDIPDYTDDIEALNEEMTAITERIIELERVSDVMFDTVADLVASDLPVNTHACVYGYYSKGDNGAALYKIVDEQPSGYYHAMNNGMYAEYVRVGATTPEQFGAYGDGVHLDQDSINAALALGGNCEFATKTYLIDGNNTDGYIKPVSNSVVNFNWATIKINPTYLTHYTGIGIVNADNVTIENFKILGDRDEHLTTEGEHGHGLALENANFIEVNNGDISDCWGDGIYIGGNAVVTNSIIKNVRCNNNRRNGISVTWAQECIIEDCKFSGTNGTAPECGIAVESNSADNIISNVIFKGCVSSWNDGDVAAYASCHAGGSTVTFENCIFVHIGGNGVAFTCLGEESSNVIFTMRDCSVTATTSFILSGINNNSSVTLENINLYRCVVPLRFGGFGSIGYCQGIYADLRVWAGNLTDGLFLPFTTLRKCMFKYDFINCAITDPRVLGMNNVDWETVSVEINTNNALIVTNETDIGTGASNKNIIIAANAPSSGDRLAFGPIPIGTEYTVTNLSAYPQVIRSRPNGAAIIGWTAQQNTLASNNVLVYKRISADSIIGISYAMP